MSEMTNNLTQINYKTHDTEFMHSKKKKKNRTDSVLHLNLSRPARPLVVSSSGKSSKGRASGTEQYPRRVCANSALLLITVPSSMKPRAQHTNPEGPSNSGWNGIIRRFKRSQIELLLVIYWYLEYYLRIWRHSVTGNESLSYEILFLLFV